MQPVADLVGHHVGHYHLLRPLGSGRTATVYQAEDVHLHRQVAIKVFRPEAGETRHFLRHFTREAQVLANLDHPHILLVHDYGEQEEFAYLVMPLMTQGSLKDLLSTQHRFALAEILQLAEQILHALQYAHEHGLVHRDIKPANLLCKSDGTLLLSDFGLVKILSARDEQPVDLSSLLPNGKKLDESSLAFAGTPAYMAPEQIQGKATAQSDIYSVGVVLYELLTGHCPFRAEKVVDVLVQHLTTPPRPLLEVRPDIPPHIAAAVMRALDKDPHRRYASAGDFLQALRASEQAADLPHSDDLKVTASAPGHPVLSARADSSDPFQTQEMDTTLTTTQTSLRFASPPAAPAPGGRRRGWLLRRIMVALFLVLIVAGSTFAALAYQRNAAQRAPGSPAQSGKSHPSTPSVVAAGTSTPRHDTGAVLPITQTCPRDDTHANRAETPPLPRPANHQNLVYLTRALDAQASEITTIQRYDLTTRRSSTILTLPPGSAVQAAQISGDGQWIMLSTDRKIQLVRIDGQDFQTLYCTTTRTIRGALWSPDRGAVVFNLLSPAGTINPQTPLTMDELFTASGTLSILRHATVGTGYTPFLWASQGPQSYSTFYATNYESGAGGGPLVALPGNLYVFHGSSAPILLVKTNGCQAYTLSPDSSHLFTNRCNPASGPQGPSTILEGNTAQGPSSWKTILGNSPLSIFQILAISNTTLLLDVTNLGSDRSQDGLWTINMDGTSLHQVSTTGHMRFTTLNADAYQDAWTMISRDGQWCLNGRGYILLNGPAASPVPVPFPDDLDTVLGWGTI